MKHLRFNDIRKWEVGQEFIVRNDYWNYVYHGVFQKFDYDTYKGNELVLYYDNVTQDKDDHIFLKDASVLPVGNNKTYADGKSKNSWYITEVPKPLTTYNMPVNSYGKVTMPDGSEGVVHNRGDLVYFVKHRTRQGLQLFGEHKIVEVEPFTVTEYREVVR